MAALRISPPDKLAVFCAAKSAGTSVSNLLYSELGSGECLREFQELPFSVLGHIHRDRLEAYLRALPRERLDQVRVLVGHLPVDLAGTMPDVTYRYAMIIREPVARMVSSFFYINQTALLKDDPEYLNALLHRHISKADDVVYANPLTRLLTGSEALVPREAQAPGYRPLAISPADFAAARNRLANFVFVGLTERLNDSTRILFDLLGREYRGSVPRDNVTEVTLSVRDLHPDTLSLMRRMLALDINLYEDAVEMFGRAAADNGLPPFHYEKPDIQLGFVSSGDDSHLTSAASAFGDQPDAVWVAAPQAPQEGDWLGFDFGEDTICSSICLQLPHVDGEEILLQLEASSDDFRHEDVTIGKLRVKYDGSSRAFRLNTPIAKRMWRVRCLQKQSDKPLAVCYLKFNATDKESPRDLTAVAQTIRRSRMLTQTATTSTIALQ
jgi:hypothetical protein